jgi:hypothetical protein
MLSDRLRQVEEHLELSQIRQFETEYWQILADQPAETAIAVKSAVEFRFLLTVLKTGELTHKKSRNYEDFNCVSSQQGNGL